MLSNLRAATLVTFATCALALVVPSTASATPDAVFADSFSQATPSGVPTQLSLQGRASYDAFITVTIGQQPAHGSVEVVAPQACSYPEGKATCLLPVRYTSTRGYVGSDSFTFLVQANGGSELIGTVMLDVQGRYPVLPAYADANEPIRVTAGDGILTTARGLLPGAAFVRFGDLPAQQAIDVQQDGAGLIQYAYPTPGTYTIAVLNRDVDVEFVTRRTVIVAARPLTKPTPPPPTLTVPPNTVGTFGTQGLHVEVFDGSITVNASAAGTQTFQSGQFGFVPSLTTPPIVLPNNPGLQFTPPPSFTSPNAPAAAGVITVNGASNGTSLTAQVDYTKKRYCNDVDCVVRSKPRATSTPQPKPQLWYIDAAGSLQPVIGSTKHGARNSTDVTAGVITVTLDDTSTPTAAILDSGFRYIVITPRRLTAKQLAAKALPGAVVGWPGRTSVITGAHGGCPSTARGACTVRLVATATNGGVRKVVGVKTLRLRPGQRVPLNFTLQKPGRWRYAEGELNALVQLTSTTPLKRLVHQRIAFRVRAKLG